MGMSRVRRAWLAGMCVGALLAGCEGTSTGTKGETINLQSDGSGGFAAVKVKLTPDMSPVALNFRAEHGIDASQAGKWNRYEAAISQNGSVLRTGQFNFNYTGNADSQPGANYQVQTMMMFTFNEAGEFDVVIKPVKPVEVTVSNARLEIRKNIQVITK
jgi:hypothetical protein